VPKRKAVRLWHDARRFERQTRKPGAQDGYIGRNGLAVLHAPVRTRIARWRGCGRCAAIISTPSSPCIMGAW
jgi:hypothetical protein